MTVAPSSSTERFSLDITESDDMTACEEYPEEDGGVEDGSCDTANIDDSKMMRVCDKLIEVFLVDKPTTTDWRRLLAFSREWIDIWPHFYKRCRECADSESDPGLGRLGNVCLAAAQAYDNASQSIEALNAAELKFNDIISSPTVDAACREIDNLAEKRELDSALMLMITKAWSAAKESNMMKNSYAKSVC